MKYSGIEIYMCMCFSLGMLFSRKVEEMLFLFFRDFNVIVCGWKGRVGFFLNF